MNTTYVYKLIDSPVGELKLVASERGLAAVLWKNDVVHRAHLNSQILDEKNVLLQKTENQLREYFMGQRHSFKLPLDFQGTDFQKEVWHALLHIPYGETRSYKEIAQQIKRPNAMRAVGAANGKNPVSIITPCHRVIGASGELTGFAGGLSTKAFLLALESRLYNIIK